MSLQHYCELFIGQVEVINDVGITIADESLVEYVTAENGRVNSNAEDKEEVKQFMLAA